MKIFEELSKFRGSQIIGIDTITNVPLRGGKSNPQQGRITKLITGNVVMIFTSGKGYRNMVNRRIRKEFESEIITTERLFTGISKSTEFTPGPRPWGRRVPNTPFVEHKGNHYLECIFLRPGTTKYFLDGKEIDKSKVQGLPIKTEGEQGGLKQENKVILRTFKLDSIIKVRKSQKEILGGALLKS